MKKAQFEPAGQLSWFIRVSNIPDRDERDYTYAIHRYRKEVKRLYGVLERQLRDRSYVCDDYSIAGRMARPGRRTSRREAGNDRLDAGIGWRLVG